MVVRVIWTVSLCACHFLVPAILRNWKNQHHEHCQNWKKKHKKFYALKILPKGTHKWSKFPVHVTAVSVITQSCCVPLMCNIKRSANHCARSSLPVWISKHWPIAERQFASRHLTAQSLRKPADKNANVRDFTWTSGKREELGEKRKQKKKAARQGRLTEHAPLDVPRRSHLHSILFAYQWVMKPVVRVSMAEMLGEDKRRWCFEIPTSDKMETKILQWERLKILRFVSLLLAQSVTL